MWRSWLLACIAGLLAALLMQPAEARPRHKERERPQLERGLSDDRGESSAAVAAEMALKANGGGRVLSAERANGGYRVKVLKDGEVRTHLITLE